MAKTKTKFICQDCGYESPKWMGKCPGCNAWNSMTEEIEKKASRRGGFTTSDSSIVRRPEPITSIESRKEPRIRTEMKELNRVLGGGIVQGSLVLIGGDPGIGKSTLLLQVCAQLAQNKQRVLYLSGEESVQQTKLRADRLNVSADELFVLAETD